MQFVRDSADSVLINTESSAIFLRTVELFIIISIIIIIIIIIYLPL